MAEATGPVEREARQLVEAAARWLSAVPDQQDNPSSAADHSPEPTPEAEDAAEEAMADPHDAPAGDAGEHLCRGCPWCRAKAAAGPIGAETLDSLAQLLGAAAESLSLFAQSRREAAERAERTDPADAAHGGAEDRPEDADPAPAREQQDR